MRAISLWQPWASAVALGAKRIETRHWATDYRGPLVMHAAQRKVKGELLEQHGEWHWIGALTPAGWNWGADNAGDIHKLPFGALVATCELVDCRPSTSFTQADLDTVRVPARAQPDLYHWTERQMGNFDPGRFGWVLENIRPMAEPIPFRGAQGFFNVPDELLAEHLGSR